MANTAHGERGRKDDGEGDAEEVLLYRQRFVESVSDECRNVSAGKYMVVVELFRRYGKENVYYLNAEKEIDFIVPDKKLAIQVSYSIKEETTNNREVSPLVKYTKAHEDWSVC